MENIIKLNELKKSQMMNSLLWKHDRIATQEYEDQMEYCKTEIKNLEDKIPTFENGFLSNKRIGKVCYNMKSYYKRFNAARYEEFIHMYSFIPTPIPPREEYEAYTNTKSYTKMTKKEKIYNDYIMGWFDMNIKPFVSSNIKWKPTIKKEELVMAVFHPNRLERMMEQYGNDWMDNV